MTLIPVLGKQRKADLSSFKDILVYTVSSTAARTTQRNAVSKQNENKKAKESKLLFPHLLPCQCVISPPSFKSPREAQPSKGSEKQDGVENFLLQSLRTNITFSHRPHSCLSSLSSPQIPKPDPENRNSLRRLHGMEEKLTTMTTSLSFSLAAEGTQPGQASSKNIFSSKYRLLVACWAATKSSFPGLVLSVPDLTHCHPPQSWLPVTHWHL